MADGKFVPMPQGYPKFKKNGDKNFFIFPVPRFSDAVTIDPVMNVVKHTGEKPTCPTEGKPTAGGKASVKHTNALLAIFVLIVMLLFL